MCATVPVFAALRLERGRRCWDRCARHPAGGACVGRGGRACVLALVLITKATKALGLYLRPDAFGVARDQPDLPGAHETLTHCLRLRP